MIAALNAIARDPVLRLIALAILFTGSTGAALGPYQSILAVEVFGLGHQAYSAVLVIAALISVSSSVTVGILTDQFARRRLTALLSVALVVTGTALVRLAPSPVTFVLTHALLLPLSASLFGQFFALARIVTQDRPVAERDQIAAVIRAAFALPFIVVLPLWSAALGMGVPLINVYLLALASSACGLLLILRDWPADETLPANRRSGQSFRAAMAEIADRRVAARMLALGLIGSSVNLYMVLLGLMFTSVPGRGEGEVALFAGLTAGLEVPFMLLTGQLLRRLSKPPVIALGAAIHAGFMLTFSQSAGFSVVLPLALPAAMGAGILLTVPVSYMQDMLAHRPGAGGALIAVNQFLAAAFAALAFLVGTQISGYPLAAMLGAVFALGGAALLLRLDRRA